MEKQNIKIPNEADYYSCGIYCITNTTKNKDYIGQSQCLKSRITQHISQLKANKHPNREMQSDYNNGDVFTCKVLYKVSQSLVYLLEGIETFYILKYQSNITGYNGDYGSKQKPLLAQKQAINPFIITNLSIEELKQDITNDPKSKMILQEILFLLSRINWSEEELYLFLKQFNFYNELGRYTDKRIK